MLVLRFKCNESIILNHVVNIQVVEIRRSLVRLGFEFPREYGIAYGESNAMIGPGQEDEETILMRRLITIMKEKAGASASAETTLSALAALADRELARPAGK
jgi:carbon storage regulator CsrA